MKQHDLDVFLDLGLTVIHMKLILYLKVHGTCYMHDVVADNKKRIYRRFIELAVKEKPEVYQKVQLEPVVIFGGSRPRTSGIKLTAFGLQLAYRIEGGK